VVAGECQQPIENLSSAISASDESDSPDGPFNLNAIPQKARLMCKKWQREREKKMETENTNDCIGF
jgi:hypothetical protein